MGDLNIEQKSEQDLYYVIFLNAGLDSLRKEVEQGEESLERGVEQGEDIHNSK